MTNFTFKTEKVIDRNSLLNLYSDAGWRAYTNDLPKLQKAIENSLFVVSVWENNSLVGLIRAVGDGETIIYIQDILILKTHQRKGLGEILMKQVLEKFANVRQIVLLSEDIPKNRAFYESQGFESCDKGLIVAFIYKK